MCNFLICGWSTLSRPPLVKTDIYIEWNSIICIQAKATSNTNLHYVSPSKRVDDACRGRSPTLKAEAEIRLGWFMKYSETNNVSVFPYRTARQEIFYHNCLIARTTPLRGTWKTWRNSLNSLGKRRWHCIKIYLHFYHFFWNFYYFTLNTCGKDYYAFNYIHCSEKNIKIPLFLTTRFFRLYYWLWTDLLNYKNCQFRVFTWAKLLVQALETSLQTIFCQHKIKLYFMQVARVQLRLLCCLIILVENKYYYKYKSVKSSYICFFWGGVGGESLILFCYRSQTEWIVKFFV